MADPGFTREGMPTPKMGVKSYYYRPQGSCGKVMFLHLSVSHSIHGGVSSASVYAGIHTSLGRHPPEQTPPWAETPPGLTPPGQTPPGRHPLPSACWDTHPLLPSACWDRHDHYCGRYGSYWNAFLFGQKSALNWKNLKRKLSEVSGKSIIFLNFLQ